MKEAAIITVASVLLGGLVGGLLRRDNRWLAVLQTLAIAAVVTGVLAQLLPEAIERLGGAALVAFAAALALPAIVTPLLKRIRRDAALSVHSLGVELASLGFIAHQVVEGLAIGTYASDGHHGHGHRDLVLAVAAHTLPLTAVFVSEALLHRGRRSALRRTLAIAAATIFGFALAQWAQTSLDGTMDSWLSAGVAGFLVHVIFHGHGKQPQRTAWQSTLETIAACIGVALPIVAVSQGSSHAGDTVRQQVGTAFLELLAETAPMLLVGLILGALLQVFGARIPARVLRRGSSFRQALRGIAVGAPLPLCACGVLPIAESLRRRGAGPALVMAFLIATPELGPETLMLTMRFLGGPFAVLRVAAALGVALAAALVFARVASSPGNHPASISEPVPPTASSEAARSPASRSALAYFDELLLHTAPWTLVGLLAAAFVEVVTPAGSLAPLARSGLDVVVIGIIAMPAYVCAASATPLAAILLLKGISPGAVLVGLLLGPATNIATVGLLRRAYGSRAVAITVATVFGVVVVLGYGINLIGMPVHAVDRLLEPHEHGWIAIASGVVLAVALVSQLWRWGLGPWFAILEGSHDHDHDHDHDDHHHEHDGDGHDHELPTLAPPYAGTGPVT